ncbi:4Fe-4S binding protein [Tissierella sp. Yu-01]|uniref:4Fe-4S binding protein n=1 Tax=Tissierella sp. Yu-01 TaxID=3035694 RepID=UPI00240D39B9|nr:4Fe-4S binding protein [Tissierella sp. Yu-01]WFA09988.1 4Fe-4S binding protein [Tissierella sp. Yu-01]
MIFDYIFDRLTEQNHAKVIEDKCIYYKNNSCDKCKNVCSEGAISIEYQVNIDEDLCSACGICKAICPTQAIAIKGIGEENILHEIKDKKNIIFTCSYEDGIGNLKLNCLNSFHPELLATLFILYEDKKFNFNLSRCKTCKYCNSNNIFKESLNKAISFVKKLNIDPIYEIHFDEEEVISLSDITISRRELFRMLKIGTANIATQTIDTIVSQKDDYLSIRKILLNAINSRSFNIENIEEPIYFMSYEVNKNCNGCGKCEKNCPDGAWKVDYGESSIRVYHNVSQCHNCGLCKENCPEKAISNAILNLNELEGFRIKNEIVLTTCKSCGKKFVSKDQSEKCVVCFKKDNLRKILSSY